MFLYSYSVIRTILLNCIYAHAFGAFPRTHAFGVISIRQLIPKVVIKEIKYRVVEVQLTS
jgi:hypothetical protein